jgi:PiT family inorganic phosphate transporter
MITELSLPALIGLILVALAFDFLNGLHDTANSIATLVSTRMLRPRYAVIWAAFFNFIAFVVFGVHVARTMGVGIVSAEVMDAHVIFGALMGAISWNLITWWAGIPSSSSHALIGGLVGAGVIKAGVGAIVWPGLLTTGAFIVLSPMLGFILALLLVLAVSWAFARANPHAVEPTFQWLQFAAASLISLGHGGNDAQKTMGIIAVLLFSQGHLGGDFYVPFWVVITCQATMGLGTFIGGWRIVRTVGSKITRMTPVQGCCASAGGAIMLFAATYLGIPVSTTHTVTGAIIGVGAARKASAVRWNIAGNILVAWVITLPAAALMAAFCYLLSKLVSII